MIWQLAAWHPYAPWLIPHHAPGFNLLVHVCAAGRVRSYNQTASIRPNGWKAINLGIYLSSMNPVVWTGGKGLSPSRVIIRPYK